MNLKILMFLCLALVLICAEGNAQKRRRRFRMRKARSTTTTENPFLTNVNEPDGNNENDANIDDTEAKEQVNDSEIIEDDTENTADQQSLLSSSQFPRDPCERKRCGPARECTLTEDGKARCKCIESCPEFGEDRRSVCSNYNETWNSDCELYMARCLCDEKSEKCENPDHKHLHIDYYGECKDIQTCSTEEMNDFPRRMRDWLFNIMREMADRRELSPNFLKLEREAERSMDEGRRASVAAVWKFCDLDSHPNDRSVSRHELFPIRAPLLALEHCIAPFLDDCDVDNDHRITLQEWGRCLEVSVDELEDKCDDVRSAHDDDDDYTEYV